VFGDDSVECRVDDKPNWETHVMRQIRVLVADDHQLMLEAIRLAFANESDLEIVGEALAGSEVLPLARRTQPDVVLLDVSLPVMDGLRCLELLRRRHPNIKVAMLSGIDDARVVRAAFDLGASCYVLKSIDPRDLASAVRQVVENSVLHAAHLGAGGNAANAAAAAMRLSERELSILDALATGKSNKEIAKHLCLAEQTVKFHLTNMYRKLGVTSRTDAIRWAYRHGVVANPTLNGEPAVTR
jgi:DNA-binding NarL/FixJ family response regulator